MEDRSIVIPNVYIPVLSSQYSYIGVAPDHQNLSAAYLFAPGCFEGLGVDDAKLAFTSSKHQIISLMVC